MTTSSCNTIYRRSKPRFPPFYSLLFLFVSEALEELLSKLNTHGPTTYSRGEFDLTFAAMHVEQSRTLLTVFVVAAIVARIQGQGKNFGLKREHERRMLCFSSRLTTKKAIVELRRVVR